MARKSGLLTSLSDSAGKWIVIINLVIVIAGFVSSYSVNQYKQEVMQTRIDKLEARVAKVESFNPELIVKQLQEIQSANSQLNDKIEKQSGRIDNVLEILVKK